MRKLCNGRLLFFMVQSHLIRLSFRWWIRIYHIQKPTGKGKRWNLKFSETDALFLFSRCSRYFENFFPKTWSNSNKKVIFGISSVRTIWLCGFRRKTEKVLDFWIAGILPHALMHIRDNGLFVVVPIGTPLLHDILHMEESPLSISRICVSLSFSFVLSTFFPLSVSFILSYIMMCILWYEHVLEWWSSLINIYTGGGGNATPPIRHI